MAARVASSALAMAARRRSPVSEDHVKRWCQLPAHVVVRINEQLVEEREVELPTHWSGPPLTGTFGLPWVPWSRVVCPGFRGVA